MRKSIYYINGGRPKAQVPALDAIRLAGVQGLVGTY